MHFIFSAGDDFAEDQKKPAAKKPVSYEEFLRLRGAKEVERREGFVPKKKKKNLTKIVTVSFLFGLWFITDFLLAQWSSVSLLLLSQLLPRLCR